MRTRRPVAVQASILQYARRITEAATEGQPVVDCVIAVPAWFGPAQRQALLDAGQVLDSSFPDNVTLLSNDAVCQTAQRPL